MITSWHFPSRFPPGFVLRILISQTYYRITVTVVVSSIIQCRMSWGPVMSRLSANFFIDLRQISLSKPIEMIAWYNYLSIFCLCLNLADWGKAAVAEVVKTEDKKFLLSHPRKRTTSSPEIENHSQTVLYAVWNILRIFSTRPLQKFRHINSWSQVRGRHFTTLHCHVTDTMLILCSETQGGREGHYDVTTCWCLFVCAALTTLCSHLCIGVIMNCVGAGGWHGEIKTMC